MKQEKENRACALEFNNLLYDLTEQGHSNNAIANGIIFSLCIHIINSKFRIDEIIMQMRKLYFEIKSELGKIEETDEITKREPINPQWD